MFAPRPNSEPLDRYTGPYERWTYAQELGLPFAFPAIRNGVATHFTALLEGKGTFAQSDGLTVRIPPMWSSDPSVTPFVMHDEAADLVATVESQDAKLSRLLERLGPPRFRLNMPIDPETWPTDYDAALTLDGWTPPDSVPKAIVGIIDDGIPFAHRAFRDANGKSRVNLCWLQSARADERAAVPFGREITNTQINALRETHGNHEPRIYRDAGAIDRDLPELGTILSRNATHGAHIAGIAAGNDPFVGAKSLPDDVQILAVQLPNTIAWDTSGFGKEMMMLSAIQYVFHRARAIADHYGVEEIPLVLNFSYGWSASRHDGESSFETAVEELLEARRAKQGATALVMPTGNNFADDMHARFIAPDIVDHKIEFGWQVQPDDRTSSYLEIWLPKDFDPDGWQVTVTPPAGSELEAGGTLAIAPDLTLQGGDPRRFAELERNGANIGQISADQHKGNRWRVMLALLPTTTAPHDGRRAPAGLWTISIDTAANPIGDMQSVDVWIQRDDDPTQMGTGGRQSRLVDLRRPKRPISRWFDDHLDPVRGYGCMNGIASAPSTVRVAGYVRSDGSLSVYSGSGALTLTAEGEVKATGQPPSMCAVADEGYFRPGLPSIGVLSGSGARVVGTSAAAAAASRLMVENAAAGRDLMTGFTPFQADPGDSAIVAAKKRARTGGYIVPPVCGTAPVVPFERSS